MITLLCDKAPRILKAKKQLEGKLNLKITIEGKKITIEGNPEDEYIGDKVIRALDYGFPFADAITISTDLNLLEFVGIKEHTYRKDLKTIRARIIGKEGRTMKVLRSLTGCAFELKDNEVGIVGSPENIATAKRAVISIIQGAKQADVYNYLEKHQPLTIDDLGLKEKKK